MDKFELNCYSIFSNAIADETVVVAENIKSAIDKYINYWKEHTDKIVTESTITDIRLIQEKIVY